MRNDNGTIVKSLSKLRNSLYNLDIGGEGCARQTVWMEKLKNILQADIHRRPLGCKINNTHIKIGDIHMESFYEARILFSHARWINYFTEWLKQQIEKDIDAVGETAECPLYVFLVGYETYIEPILFALKWDLAQSHGQWNIRYGIYEEPKFLQSTGDQISDIRIRYLDRGLPKNVSFTEKNTRIINICGISSTLSTFHKIDEKIKEFFPNVFPVSAIVHYSLIQVLPFESEKLNRWTFADSERILTWRADRSGQEATAFWPSTSTSKTNTKETLTAKYLISVDSVWHNADKCPLCYPKIGSEHAPLLERPIIETSETSMIPIQMIELVDNLNPGNRFYPSNCSRLDYYDPNDDAYADLLPRRADIIDFFAYEKKGIGESDRPYSVIDYKYIKYLYYGHTGRMDNHFKFFVRTGALFQKILEESQINPESNHFLEFCQTIRSKLFHEETNGGTAASGAGETDDASDELKTVDIIISTTDFSDNAFASAINKHVFQNRAHMISLEPKKEFRSNFLTKYSNISYFIDQTRSEAQANTIIRFHYIDDQIIIGDAFYRAKSLVQSLMSNSISKCGSNTKIFETVIVLLSRNSKSTQADYVTNPSHFFSLIEINVPSVRNYADSCPLCKLRSEAKAIAKTSVLSFTEQYWLNKSESYALQTLRDVRRKTDFLEKSNREMINRQFRRFHCENILWEALGRGDAFTRGADELEIGESLIETINSVLSTIGSGKRYQFEYLIGFINAMSKPFLYFKENNKKVALQFAIQMIERLCSDEVVQESTFSDNKSAIYFDFSFSTKRIKIEFLANWKRYGVYSLLVTIINCLAAMDSTYLLYADNIRKIVKLGGLIEATYIEKTSESTEQAVAKLCDFPPKPGEKFNGFYLEIMNIAAKKYKESIDEKKQLRESLMSPYLFEVLFQAIKRALSGTSKEYKRIFFQNQLRKVFDQNLENDSASKLWRALLLENCVMPPDETIVTDYIRRKEKKNLLESYKEITDNIQLRVNSEAKKMNKGCRITDLTFLYFDRPMNRSYELTDPPIRLEAGALEKLVCYWEEESLTRPTELTQFGCGQIGASQYLIAVHTDWGTAIDTQPNADVHPDNGSQARDYSLVRAIFMRVTCEGRVSEREVLEYIICPVLSYRHKLKERFSLDLASNAIRNAIQAKAGEALVASDKAFSHGHRRDITNAMETLKQFGREAYAKQMNQKTTDFTHIERLVSLFMNLCISKTNNQSIKNDYFQTETKEENQLRQADLFNNTCKRVPENMRPLCRFLIKSFFKEITKPDYPNIIDPASSKKYRICVMYDDRPMQECSSEEEAATMERLLNAVPLFMVPINTEEENLTAVFCLMGMIDVLIRNALSHGVQSADGSYKINLNLKPGSDAEHNTFCVCVKNRRKPQTDENKPQGITWRFFDELSKDGEELADRTGFEVRHDKGKDAEYFEAQIIIRCGFEQSDSNVDDLQERGRKDDEYYV